MKKQLFLLLAAFWLATAIYAQQPIPYGNNPKAGHQVAIRGFNMYYETYGAGKPLLFIHGNGGSVKDFSMQIPYFSKNYKVILADSRAQGKSKDTSDSLNYNIMTEDLNALLNLLHLDSCYVIGWSDGGINGLLLAMRHPEKVKRLAITGANLWPDATAVDPEIFQWLVNEVDTLSQMKPTPEVKNQYKLLNMMLLEPHITLEQLHAIKCPTLVIGGDQDVILPKHTLAIAEAIPNAYLWIVPNSGHATLIGHSKLFNETVADFFKKPFKLKNGLEKLGE
jgi:pimeloyl-ACP methyl ester carboxylesterase